MSYRDDQPIDDYLAGKITAEEAARQRADRERNEAIGRAIGRPLGWVLGFLGHAVLRGVAAKIEERIEGKRKQ